MTLTQKELKELLLYNPDTGNFHWKKARKRVKAGAVTGTLRKDSGCIIITLNHKVYQAHRLAWLYLFGHWPKGIIDHINHNQADNRASNLRDVTILESGKNKSFRKDNTSGYVGVTWHKGLNKWAAGIMVEGKQIHLGYFTNIKDAAKVRKTAEHKYGFHKNHGMNTGRTGVK